MFVGLAAAALAAAGLSGTLCAAAEEASAETQDALGPSAHVRTDRNLQLLLSAAAELLDRGDLAGALESLDRVLASEEDAYVPAGDGRRYVNAHREANRLLGQIPAHLRRSWEPRQAQQVRQALQEAIAAGDLATLASIAGRYRLTAPGLEALQVLSTWRFDHGRFADAAVGFRRVAEHPLADRQARASAAARMILSAARAGELAQTRRWVWENRPFVDTATFQHQGEEVSLADWLRNTVPDVLAEPARGGADVWVAPEQAGRLLYSVPGVQPAWQKDLFDEAELAAFVGSALNAWRDQGVHLLGSGVPIVAGSLAVVRSPDGIAAYNMSTGDVAWKNAVGSLTTRISDNPKLLENERVSQFYAEALADRLLANRVLGTLTTDGARVYGVLESASTIATESATQFGGRGSRRDSRRPATSCLAAWDLATGKELWRYGETSDAAAATPVADGELMYVHGPATFRDGCLHVVVRVEGEMRLAVLDAASGRLEWSLPLADISRSSASDRRHQRVLCPVASSNGTLFCATSSGAIVAVDLTTRSPKWALRYERSDVPGARRVAPGRWAPDRHLHWWNNWQDSTLLAAGDRVIAATPDSDALRALDAETGAILWERPRGEGLFVAGAVDGRLIVVEEHHVACVDLAGGGTIWRTAIGQPAGRGVFAETDYLLPLEEDELAAVRLADGSVRRFQVALPGSLGNLACSKSGLIAQTPARIAAIVSLEAAESRVAQESPSRPGDATLLLHQAQNDLQAGRFQEGVARLSHLLDQEKTPQALPVLRRALLDRLRDHPEDWETVAAKIGPLNTKPAERAESLLAVAAAHRALGNRPQSLEACFELLSLESVGSSRVADADGPPREVRFDRRVRAEMAELLAEATPDELARLDDVFARRLEAVAGRSDPLAIDALVAQVGGLRWESLVQRKLGDRALRGADLISSQLRLLGRIEDDEALRAAASLRGLAELYESRGYHSDAAACYRRLCDEFPELELENGQTAPALVREMAPGSALRKEIEQGRTDPWGDDEPTLDEGEARYRGIEYLPIPVEALPGSLFDRVTVYVHVQGRSLRFQGDEYRTEWQVPLPETKAPVFLLPPLSRGWGLGHLLILRLGTDLLGVSIHDESGEPDARILWRIETVNKSAMRWNSVDLRIEPAPFGFGPDNFTIVDRYGWTYGRVGPVRAGYVCYRDCARLIAVDPRTGKRFWQRDDVDHDALLTGNDDYVFLLRPDEPRVEVLRALDGKTVAYHDLKARPRDFLTLQGKHALIALERSQSMELRQIDLVSGTPSWRKEFPAASTPFGVDGETIGVLTPDGTLHFIAAKTGRETARHRVERPARLIGIYAAVDERNVYVALSGPHEDQRLLRWSSELGEYRNPPVNGPLFAFDRGSGRLLWQIDLRDAAFRLDQPREAPFLILNYRRATGDGDRPTDASFITRCLDRRTGRDLLMDEQPRAVGLGYQTIEARPDDKAIDLVLPNKTLRLQYSR